MSIINTLQAQDPFIGFHLGFLITLIVLILLWKSYQKTKSEFTRYFIYFFVFKNFFYFFASVAPFLFLKSPEIAAKLAIVGWVLINVALIPLTIITCKLFLPRLLKPAVIFLTVIIVIHFFGEIIFPAPIVTHPVSGLVLFATGPLSFWWILIAHGIFMIGPGIVFIYHGLRLVEKRTKIRGVLMGLALIVCAASGLTMSAFAAIPIVFWIVNLFNGTGHALMGVAAAYKIPPLEKASGKTEQIG